MCITTMRVTLCSVVLFGLVALWAPSIESARILGVWPMEAPSHFFLGNRIFKELAARGHEVTMISPFPQKTPVKNFRDIVLKDMKQKLMSSMPSDKKMDFVKMGQLQTWQQILFTASLGTKVTELTLEAEPVKDLLANKNEKFDLIIFEMFHTEILYGLAHHYNCPVIVLSTVGSSVWTNHLVGNPAPSSYIPDLFLNYAGQMTLVERIHNTAVNFFTEIHRKFFYFPELDKTMHKYFPNAPPLEELMYKKTAMILLNSHPSFNEPKPHVPAMVEIGGFHIETPKPLPKDIKDYMDNAKNGVILFSMGSNLKSVDLSEETRNIILRTFAKLKQQVIWKWEDENLPGKPANVKIMKWAPQSDILAHPNLKLFITHGGLLSTTEAVYHGVPVIGIPIFGDQKMNVAMTNRKGFGIGVDYTELSEETLGNALKEILNNPKYRENAKKASHILSEQPIKPIDAAVYWINHVIQHKGADHFRTAAMNLEWYQLYSVDLIAIVVLADLVLLIVFYTICKKLCCKKKNCDDKKKKDAAKKKN